MDLDLTDEQRAVREMARKFADEYIVPVARDNDVHERFDGIILDPPAFVKSRSKVREGLQGYWEINRRAMRLVKPGGYLITCSCSYHVDPETFRSTLSRAARAARRTVALVEMRSQGKDHPVLLPLSESAYLKCAVLMLVD